MLLAWTTLHNSKEVCAFIPIGKSNSVHVVAKGSVLPDDAEQQGGIRALFKVMKATKTMADKTIGVATASYGLSLVAYGFNFPTQMRVLTIANAGGFNKIRRTSLAVMRGAVQSASTATIRSPSLVFATAAIANSKKRKNLAKDYEKEHAVAMVDGKLSKEEYEKLKKIRRRQVKLEERAIRRIKSARNFFTRTVQNSNLRNLKTILGDTVLMGTAILASRETSILGNYIYRYYTTLNMGGLFLNANEKVGYPLSSRITRNLYIFDTTREDLVFDQPDEKPFFLNPITKFFLAKLPFCSYEKDSEDVAAEEAAFVRNVGAILTYGIAACLNIYTPVLARKTNAALTASSLAVHGLSGVLGKNDRGESDISDDGSTQPGLLKGGYGGQLTLGLTAVSLVMGFMLEHNNLNVPKFWKPMTNIDNFVEESFGFGSAIL
eukprot:CAMPEP_0198261620 /NCGR_PEP_ID=MMETSP1447-20131203/10308_1 /TAXON_ID=420782 /ORGANISM="Chaetoceros dichaeta, Strain CCMP1751" /LENGTH=434 /DNA_ID=CAMNT_0043949595 /DNA_START=127 /DNA_END=1431 /DNA_ORIENTATION=-